MNTKNLINHKLTQQIKKLLELKFNIAENYISHVNYLAIRLYMGVIFWKSGDTKITGDGLFGLPDSFNVFGIDIPLIPMPYMITDSTFFLFAEEYSVPLLPSDFAAILATLAEIFLSLMLIFGFGGRIAAFGLFIMTLVIHFTYMQYDVHYVWMMLFAVIICAGPGKLSVDHFIRRKTLG